MSDVQPKKAEPSVEDLFLLPVSTWLPKGRSRKGEVGIEIEVEGRNLIHENLDKYWSYHEEGSLRGEHAEYVLTNPIRRDRVRDALEYLSASLNRAELVEGSPNTSVHVHINVQDMSVKQMYTFACAYLIFEDLLVEYCGPKRVGNLFCLRAKDAEFLVKDMVQHVRDVKRYLVVYGDGVRYSSMNLCALAKFGSIEFRAMRGVNANADLICPWVDTLLSIKDTSKMFANPRELVQAFSRFNTDAFVRNFLPRETARWVLAKEDYSARLFEGMRLMQDVAYASDWTVLVPSTASSRSAQLRPAFAPQMQNIVIMDDEDEEF